MRYLIFILTIFTLFPTIANAQTVVDVNGMVCDFCAQSLNEIFRREDAVDRLDINLNTKTVTIYYKNGERLDDETINTLVYEAGYDAVGIHHAE